jgi:hypothetical protein
MTIKTIKIEFENATPSPQQLPNNARQSSRKAIKAHVFAAVTKYNEFVFCIECGGWGGEIEKPEQTVPA